MENDNARFETKDFYLTAYLNTKGHKFISVKKRNDKQEYYFSFLKNNDLSKEIEGFYNGCSIIETTKFINSIRNLKALVNSSRS